MPATSESRIRTLGLRTDLAIESGRAIVSEHERYIAVRTPSSPEYHFGNFLIFEHAPAAGDRERWPQLFEQIFHSDAGVRHAAFAWSAAEAPQQVEAFIDRGFTFEDRVGLAAAHADTFTRRIYERCGFAPYQREHALWIAVR